MDGWMHHMLNTKFLLLKYFLKCFHNKKKQEQELKARVEMLNKKIVEIETEKRMILGEKSRLVETMNKVARGELILKAQFTPQQMWNPPYGVHAGNGGQGLNQANAPPPPHLYT